MSYRWGPYVSVAQRRAKATREMQKLRKSGMKIEPVEIAGRTIAKTFWGEAWCNHLEQFSDYENRLPRGRTYVRNGSVCHLAIASGKTQAIVSGSDLYHVEITVAPLSSRKWKDVRQRCAGQIGSMLELLQGHLSKSVMEIVTDPSEGLFPSPKEIQLSCDCPDWAGMCKHVAAVLYAIGARLDQQPELLFLLRNVDHEELITAELNVQAATAGTGKRRRLAGQDLSDVFGVDIQDGPRASSGNTATARKASQSTAKKSAQSRATRTQIAASQKTAAKATVRRPTRPSPEPTESDQRRTATPSAKSSTTSPFTPTTTGVARLRSRFEMNRAQFAKLLCVSPPTLTHWESKNGKLNLHQKTRAALNRAAGLSNTQAWAELKEQG